MSHQRAVLLVTLALATLACSVQASGDPTESLPGVLDLTPDTFSTHANGAKAALVEFYAPWCGHCKHLVPEYKKLGEIVQADPKLKNRVVIAKVDADAHRSLGEKFGVSGFPTIKFFSRGQAPSKDNAKSYNGARTADAFLSYIKGELDADKSFARVEALDEIVDAWEDATDKQSILDKVIAKVGELTGEEKVNGEMYVKVLEKAVAKGDEYLNKEYARLDKMLSGGSVAAAKADELSRKLSVLGAILGKDE